MHPILLDLKFVSIKTYGLFMVLAFLAALMYMKKKAAGRGISEKFIYDLVFWSLAVGLVGARLVYVLIDIEAFVKNPFEIFMVWRGGLVFYGGLVFGFASGLLVARKYKIESLLDIADIAAPAVALGQAIGRIGCFFAGCCYGKETNCPIGVVFNNPDSFAPVGVRVFPTQLMESFGDVLIFFFLNSMLGRPGSKGRVFVLYILSYSLLRFIIEFFRGDYRGGVVLGFTLLQWVSLMLFVCAAVFLVAVKAKDA